MSKIVEWIKHIKEVICYERKLRKFLSNLTDKWGCKIYKQEDNDERFE